MRIILCIFLSFSTIYASNASSTNTVLNASQWPAAVILASGTGAVERAFIAAKIRPLVSVDMSEKVLDLNEKNNTIIPEPEFVQSDVADHEFISGIIEKKIAATANTRFDFLFSFLPRVHEDSSRPGRGEQNEVTKVEKDAFNTTLLVMDKFLPRVVIIEALGNTELYIYGELIRRLPELNKQAFARKSKEYRILHDAKLQFADLGVPVTGGRYFIVIVLSEEKEIKKLTHDWRKYLSDVAEDNRCEPSNITVKDIWDELKYKNRHGNPWYDDDFEGARKWKSASGECEIELPFHNLAYQVDQR